MHPFVNIAVKAARKAGDYIVRASEHVNDISAKLKQPHDYVTEVDQTAEEIIIDTIKYSYPDHSILAEESGAIDTGAEYEWIIDPLDGTTNFIHGMPHFAVSIAIRQGNRIEHGVIYDPMRQELFTASRGAGAQMNNRRMRVSQQAHFDKALLGTGFPLKEPQLLEPYLNTFNKVIPLVTGIRRGGSAALDLAYVACGRFDGYWEMGLHVWDIAAGVLMVREAGGLVSDLQGGESHLKSGNILAGNPKIFKQLLKNIQ